MKGNKRKGKLTNVERECAGVNEGIIEGEREGG